MQLWIGTSGFQYPEWKGTFYPDIMPASRMLPFYAERFTSTEINYSFRRIPNAKTIDRWIAATPERFKFSFKAPQKITHFAKLRDCADTLNYFAAVLGGAGKKLGAVLFQLPPTFKKDTLLLESFLATMPAINPSFEFRHASWFDDEVFALLQAHNAALCLAEDAKLSTPRVRTANHGYVRLRREDYTYAEIEAWAGYVTSQASHWQQVFIYFKHEESGVGPRFAQQLRKALGENSVPGPAPDRAFPGVSSDKD